MYGGMCKHCGQNIATEQRMQTINSSVKRIGRKTDIYRSTEISVFFCRACARRFDLLGGLVAASSILPVIGIIVFLALDHYGVIPPAYSDGFGGLACFVPLLFGLAWVFNRLRETY